MPEPPRHVGEPLSVEHRSSIDARALSLSRHVARKRTRESFRDLSSWLTKRTPMPLDHELQRVEETHAAIIVRFQTVDTPADALAVFTQLLDVLPTALEPTTGPFVLTILEANQPFIASGGQNRIYVSTQLLTSKRGTAGDKDRLAFGLARQIAASCLRHARGWYQQEWASSLLGREATSQSRITIENATGTILDRQPTIGELFDEDLFALHLCRQAGFDVDSALDVIRHLVSDAGTDNDATRIALSRLRRVLVELRGLVTTDETQTKFGLFRYRDGAWRSTPNGSLSSTGRCVLMIHGLGSDLDAFKPMTVKLSSELGEAVQILGLRYPETDSLYRSSKFLLNELERVGLLTEACDFICHSAGGLVFRRAAEIDGMDFRTATLIGTPNHGSDLASLRPLLEAQEFFSAFRGSFSVPDLLKDDSSQLVRDLEPSSLFLSELNRASPPTVISKYRIVRGQALSSAKVVLLTLGIATAQAALQSVAESKLKASHQRAAMEWIGRFHLPKEVRAGDLAVTLTSATTQNAADVLTVSTGHTKLPDDPQVIDFIKRTITQ